MDKQIKKEIERLQVYLTESKKEVTIKDKDLKDVKVLLGVKESVEQIQKDGDIITLQIDQLDESLKLFQTNKLSKDSQMKSLTKISRDWTDLRKLARDVKKEIAPNVAQEQSKNEASIKKLEDDIT